MSAMVMSNPPHPGRLIKDELDGLGLTVAVAASGLGVPPQHLSRIIDGRDPIDPDMAIRLEKAIGSSADAWLRLQVAFDLAEIRRRQDEIVVARFLPAAP